MAERPEESAGAPGRVGYTPEQLSRLRDLGAPKGLGEISFDSAFAREAAFKGEERRLAASGRAAVREFLKNGGRHPVELLRERLARRLSREGLAEVSTPIIMSRARLARMGLEGDPLLSEQVFWLDEKRCLRPMLAPHLYEYMLDLARLSEGPFGIFEIGPCFRKESKGARHGGEFTMLNLVEVGTPLESRLERIKELCAILLGEAGLESFAFETAESSVYGQTVDVVAPGDLELASCSMGPHPLDAAWGFDGTWVGVGMGLERLAMAALGLDRISPVARGLGRLGGLTLKL